MKSITRKVLIIVASAVIALSLCAIAFVLTDGFGLECFAPETSAGGAVHPAEETKYNSDGTVSAVVYYKDNVFNGRDDYVYLDGESRIYHYNADNEETGSEKYTYNLMKKPLTYTVREGGTVVKDVTYDYYDDMETLKKETSKEYAEDGTESAEKLYYSEEGLVTRKCVYTDGELDSQTDYEYDENGELVSEKNVTGDGAENNEN